MAAALMAKIKHLESELEKSRVVKSGAKATFPPEMDKNGKCYYVIPKELSRGSAEELIAAGVQAKKDILKHGTSEDDPAIISFADIEEALRYFFDKNKSKHVVQVRK